MFEQSRSNGHRGSLEDPSGNVDSMTDLAVGGFGMLKRVSLRSSETAF
jgi:hypothetical protein